MTGSIDDRPLHQRTVGQVLSAAAARLGDKPFIVDVEGGSISYREMDQMAHRIANGLAALGIGHQEPVLYMLPDSIDFVALWAGLARHGAAEVPVNLAYRGAFLSRIANDSTAKTMVIGEQLLDRLEEVVDALDGLERCIVHPARPDVLPPKIAARFDVLGFDVLRGGDDTPFAGGPRFSEMIGIMYTSGTTGASKGVMVCHAHAYRYAWGVGHVHGLSETDNYYTAGLPMFHIACQWGVVYASMIYGATVILRRGYRNQVFWSDIAEHRGTVAFLLGAIANFLWKQPEDPADIKTPLERVGMYPVIPEHEAFAKRFNVTIGTGYGSTETPGPAGHVLGQPLIHHQCVGRPRDDFDVRFVDEDDLPCPPGTVGEMCVRPRKPWHIMLGYWRRPEETAKAFRNLWYHTGDAGYVDEEGRIFFVNRMSDSLRRRGENISAVEVEDTVNQHPDVLESAVYPVWAESEQEVMVAVTPQPGRTIDPEELVRFCNARMPYFMVPRYVVQLDEIPKTPTGKMQKYVLRDAGVTEATWDRVAAGIRLER